MPYASQMIDKFLSSVGFSDEDSCWNWLAGKYTTGYGYFYINDEKKIVLAHRFGYEIVFGDIPANLEICHKCDNPSCVNPNHLFLGTHRDNMIDAVRKGRMNPTLPDNRGENHGNHKLTESDIIDIRNKYYCGESQGDIAGSYSINQSTVSRIVNGVRWKHIGG